MGCTILSYGDPCMGCTDLYIQMRIADRISYLLKGSACCKHSKAAGEGNLTHGSQSRCNSHHITFCNTTINMPVRIRFLKYACLGRCCKICVKHNEFRIFCSQLYQRIAVAFSGRDLLYLCHYASSFFSSSLIFSRSAIAIAYSSSLGALPCQPACPSMKETPLPLML